MTCQCVTLQSSVIIFVVIIAWTGWRLSCNVMHGWIECTACQNRRHAYLTYSRWINCVHKELYMISVKADRPEKQTDKWYLRLVSLVANICSMAQNDSEIREPNWTTWIEVLCIELVVVEIESQNYNAVIQKFQHSKLK